MNNRKILLNENEIPENWYNIIADMPNKPLPPYIQGRWNLLVLKH